MNAEPSWAQRCISELASGRSIHVVVRGNSLEPDIQDGETVLLCPLGGMDVNVGDMVFVRIQRNRHLIHAVVNRSEDRYLIGNLKGGTDGWVERNAIYGVVDVIGRNEDFPGFTVEECT